jgi:hypothetical protein
MAYTILLRSNAGKVLRQLIDTDDVLTGVLPPVDDPDFPYLSRIDPYDDTQFTPLQMRALVPELRRLRELTLSPPEFLELVEELAKECMDGTHVKLLFVGD